MFYISRPDASVPAIYIHKEESYVDHIDRIDDLSGYKIFVTSSKKDAYAIAKKFKNWGTLVIKYSKKY